MNIDSYEAQLNKFIWHCKNIRPEFINYYKYPILNEDTGSTQFDPHYVYHVAWAIRKLFKAVQMEGIASHVDISSSLHFCTAVANFVPTKFIDYRPASVFVDNLTCLSGDLTNPIDWNEQFESVSCMHVVEHIGLGRYGDALSVNADIQAMVNLIKIVKPGGKLLFVVPCGRPEIYFNAHRVYSAEWIKDFFAKSFMLKEFYFIHPNPLIKPMKNISLQETADISYGCGCFEFVKN